MNKRLALNLLVSIIMVGTGLSAADENPLKVETKKAAVRQIAREYESRYVDAEIGRRLSQVLLRNDAAGQYDAIVDGKLFARRLTEDLRSVAMDFHMTVAYLPERIKKKKETPPRQLAEEERRQSRADNYGFSEVKVLEGGVGYLRLSSFDGSPEAMETAAAAMRFLRFCPSLILDLRFNPGGDPAMVQFLASYFLDGEPVLLDEFHYRENDRMEQMWSLPYVPGERLGDTDLYLLIDRFTFSSAEGLAYSLQARKRATVVGTKSAGGAHVAETAAVLDCFLLYIPTAASKNPITKGNFQGIGVIPDVPLTEEKALEEAHLLALKKLMIKSADPKEQERFKALIQDLRKKVEGRR